DRPYFPFWQYLRLLSTTWSHGSLREGPLPALPLIAKADWIGPAIVPVPLGNSDVVNLKRLRVAFPLQGGKSWGIICHAAPVHTIQRTPLKSSRKLCSPYGASSRSKVKDQLTKPPVLW